MKVTLTAEEHEKVVDLYERAQTTPMIAMTSADALSGRDWASQAWDDVRVYMDELGTKYGYKPATAKISKDSPEFEAEPA